MTILNTTIGIQGLLHYRLRSRHIAILERVNHRNRLKIFVILMKEFFSIGLAFLSNLWKDKLQSEKRSVFKLTCCEIMLQGIIIPVNTNRGDRRRRLSCKYRPITLLSIPHKVIMPVIIRCILVHLLTQRRLE